MNTNAQDVADRWASHMGSATDKIRKGVMAVQVSPGQAASQKADTWQQRVSSAEAKAKYQARTAALSLSDWQTSMTTKGINRIGQGAIEAKAKFAQFMSQFLPFIAAGQAQVRAMPNATFEDKIARAVAMMRYSHTFKRG